MGDNKRYEQINKRVRLFEIRPVELHRRIPNKYHQFHLLQPSIWPFVASLAIMVLVYGLVYWFYTGRPFTVYLGIFELFIAQIFWWRDVSKESGEQTAEVSRGLKIGMALFIISEVMFFFSFFWAFFHVSLAPSCEVGGIWPPVGLQRIVIDPWEIPLLNTFLLLASGVTVTGAHHAFLQYFELERLCAFWSLEKLADRVSGVENYVTFEQVLTTLSLLKKKSVVRFFVGVELMILTIILALVFTLLQAFEYVESLIRISDSVYGSTFFIMTGFHGLHVLIGSIFLITCLVRIVDNQFCLKHSVGLECAIWYWHFVDVVWLFLFVSIYTWGNSAMSLRNDVSIDNTLGGVGVKTADFAFPCQLGFQDSATVTMEGIVDLHHNIMIFLIFILIVIVWVMFICLYEGVKLPQFYTDVDSDSDESYDVDLWADIIVYKKFFADNSL